MKESTYSIIAFCGCKYDYDIHEVIKQSLRLPAFYGRNLDALWDSLTGIIALPAHITIRGFNKLPKDLKYLTDKMMIVFRRAEEMYDIVVIVES